MHSAKAVAFFFLKKAENEGKELTPIQVIKLVYISHGWKLGFLGEPLIYERVEAWQYGPVISSLYHWLKPFGNQPVKLSKILFISDEILSDFSKEELKIMEAVWESYNDWEGFQLSELTHRKGTPWHKTYIEGEYGKVIKNELIESHYAQSVEKIQNANR